MGIRIMFRCYKLHNNHSFVKWARNKYRQLVFTALSANLLQGISRRSDNIVQHVSEDLRSPLLYIIFRSYLKRVLPGFNSAIDAPAEVDSYNIAN